MNMDAIKAIVVDAMQLNNQDNIIQILTHKQDLEYIVHTAGNKLLESGYNFTLALGSYSIENQNFIAYRLQFTEDKKVVMTIIFSALEEQNVKEE